MLLRGLFASLPPGQEEAIARRQLAAINESGSGSFSMGDPRDLVKPFVFDTKFTRAIAKLDFERRDYVHAKTSVMPRLPRHREDFAIDVDMAFLRGAFEREVFVFGQHRFRQAHAKVPQSRRCHYIGRPAMSISALA